MNDLQRGLLCIVGATLCWSVSGVFVRWVPEVPSWTVNAWRCLGMALALLVWMVFHYRRGLGQLIANTQPQAVLISGGCFAVGSTLYIVSLQLASVATVSCIGATAGLFSALLARIWLGERSSPVFFVVMGMAILGVVWIALSEAGASISGFAGALVALMVALTFAGQSVSLRRFRAIGMEPAIFVGGVSVFIILSLVPGLTPITRGEVLILLFMGVVQLAIPLVLFMRGARHVPAAPMVLITMADSVLNPFWVWLIHGELPPSGVYGGGTLILLAISINAFAQMRMSART